MSVNKVILLGNVGQDPKVKYFDTGSAVATFPLATSDRAYTLANGTQVPERTEWHNIVTSNRLAEVVDKYVHKGDKLYLEGKIRTRSYNDQAGATRYVTEIYVDNMDMLSPKGANTGAASFAPTQPITTSAQQAPTAQSPQQLQQQQQTQQQQTQQTQVSQSSQPSQPSQSSQSSQSSQAQPVQDNSAADLPF